MQSWEFWEGPGAPLRWAKLSAYRVRAAANRLRDSALPQNLPFQRWQKAPLISSPAEKRRCRTRASHLGRKRSISTGVLCQLVQIGRDLPRCLTGLELPLSHLHSDSGETTHVRRHDSAKSLPTNTLLPKNVAKHKLWHGGLGAYSSELYFVTLN